MINLFLKAKHWQIFFLLFGVPLIFQFYIFFTMSSGLDDNSNLNTENMMNFFGWFPLIMMLFTALIFSWFWSIAIGLKEIFPEGIKMKTTKFKIFFFFPLMYIQYLMTYLAGLFNGLKADGFELGNWFDAIIFPLHLFSIFCIFYIIYYVAKTIKTAELKRSVRFGDFAVEFFLLWFYFIGIWVIQPKVNKLIENKNTRVI